MGLVKAIYQKLFVENDSNNVVVWNPDGFLSHKEVERQLQEEYHLKVYHGSSLDLRIIRETAFSCSDRILFIKDTDFEVLEDVAEEVVEVHFYLKSMFPQYSPWNKIKDFSFNDLCIQYEDNNFVYTKDSVSSGVLQDPPFSEIESLDSRWTILESNGFDFFNPGKWMKSVSELMLDALKSNNWNKFRSHIDDLNNSFQLFLKENYVNIVTSTCPSSCPRIVTQVLPFLNKQKENKTALVVVDGMNYWQGVLLGKSIQKKIDASVQYDCIYSWLPSVTELSRQAIFRADTPKLDYDQKPQNEKKLWNSFWEQTGLSKSYFYYQHDGIIDEKSSIQRLGYVIVDLDEMMHASSNFLYLYDSTKRWVEEEVVLSNIEHLLERGYRIYITTDHGNIETNPYHQLDYRDKLGANRSVRHIILPNEADKSIFEKQYDGHLFQLDESSRTYYAIGREAFCSDRCVTHGGTHLIEVLIPFITVEKNSHDR